MKKRNPLAVFFLGLITFGIYDLYWLVKTKQVLNEKTRSYTPTIWLLVIPYAIVIIGYGLLFINSQDLTTTTTTTNSTSQSASSSSPSSGEELNKPGTRRPAQYLHICRSEADVKSVEYVSQGSPKCLDGDAYVRDYEASVAGTVFSSPCKTVSGKLRYVYISANESCPVGTKLVFYNRINSSYETSLNTTATSSDTYGKAYSSQNTQIKHPARFFAALGLIFIGFITSFGISIFWFFRFSKAVDEYTRGKMNTAVTFLILWLIHLIGVALIQDTFNDLEDETSAPNTPIPATPMASAIPAASPQAPETQDPSSGQAPAPSSGSQNIYPETVSTSMPGVRPQLSAPVSKPDALTPIDPSEPAPPQDHHKGVPETAPSEPHPAAPGSEHHRPHTQEHLPEHEGTHSPRRFMHPPESPGNERQKSEDGDFNAL